MYLRMRDGTWARDVEPGSMQYYVVLPSRQEYIQHSIVWMIGTQMTWWNSQGQGQKNGLSPFLQIAQ